MNKKEFDSRSGSGNTDPSPNGSAEKRFFSEFRQRIDNMPYAEKAAALKKVLDDSAKALSMKEGPEKAMAKYVHTRKLFEAFQSVIDHLQATSSDWSNDKGA